MCKTSQKTTFSFDRMKYKSYYEGEEAVERNERMLFLYGSGIVAKDWFVKERNPTLYCRVYYVREGHVVYRDEHTEIVLKKEHLYIFPSTRPYEMEQDPTARLNCLHLHVEIIPYLLDELLELQVEEKSFLMHLLNTMDNWIVRHPFQVIDSVMENLAATLVAFLISEELLQNAPWKIAKSIQYITEHVKENITVESLSELCGYHKQYYIRLFNTYLGTTPHQYLISYRMKLAITLLLEGRSVSETADAVGYLEVRNFVRAFKKYYGYSPGKVKKYMYMTP